MTRQDMTLSEDIKDKARGFCNEEKKVIIRTIPSTKFPKGAKYEGYIFDVLPRLIILNDTVVMKRFHIYFSEIASPADIYEVI